MMMMKEGEQGPFSLKLCVCVQDKNSSPHGKFHQFLFPFSSKFPDLNFASYVLYIYLCGTHSEPGLLVKSLKRTKTFQKGKRHSSLP